MDVTVQRVHHHVASTTGSWKWAAQRYHGDAAPARWTRTACSNKQHVIAESKPNCKTSPFSPCSTIWLAIPVPVALTSYATLQSEKLLAASLEHVFSQVRMMPSWPCRPPSISRVKHHSTQRKGYEELQKDQHVPKISTCESSPAPCSNG